MYEGQYVKNKREGFGVKRLANGKVWEGYFRNDKKIEKTGGYDPQSEAEVRAEDRIQQLI